MECCVTSLRKSNSFSNKKGRNAKTKTNSPCKRAHHNALEQQRRQVIRNCFDGLRKSVPSLASGEKKISRSFILREAARYIKRTSEQVEHHKQHIEELRLQNELLTDQIQYLAARHDQRPRIHEDGNKSPGTLLEQDNVTIPKSSRSSDASNHCDVSCPAGMLQLAPTAKSCFPNVTLDSEQSDAPPYDYLLLQGDSSEEKECHFLEDNLFQDESQLLRMDSSDEEQDVDVEGGSFLTSSNSI